MQKLLFSCRAVVCGAVLAVALVACQKDAAKMPDSPMFANVPADTPYVIAALEPMPKDYLEHWSKEFGPIVTDAVKEAVAKESSSDGKKLFDLVSKEIGGQWNQAGLAKIGMTVSPRFIVYGLGVLPVARVEILDGKKLLPAVKRVMEAMGEKPETKEFKGVTYFEFGEKEGAAIIAIGDKEVVGAVLPADKVEQGLETLFGKGPDKKMPKDKLGKILKAHGLGPHLFAVVESATVLDVIAGRGTSKAFPPPEMPKVEEKCQAALATLAKRVPRLVMGYPTLGAKKSVMSTILELDGETAGLLKAIKASIPGLTSDVPKGALLVVGGGYQAGAMRAFMKREFELAMPLAEACVGKGASAEVKEAEKELESDFPAVLNQLRGGVAVVNELTFSGQMPKKVSAFVIVSADAPRSMLSLVSAFVPGLEKLADMPEDGEFREFPLPVPLPLEDKLYMSFSKDAVGMALGESARERAAIALKNPPESSPLFLVALDYTRILDLLKQTGQPLEPTPGLSAEAQEKLFAYLGTSTVLFDVTDKGLVFTVKTESQ